MTEAQGQAAVRLVDERALNPLVYEVPPPSRAAPPAASAGASLPGLQLGLSFRTALRLTVRRDSAASG
ncbi:MAG: hypothetical protein QOI03_2156 [Solirubrobacteraceae bacterium]|jgi:hypothetical protein|nr:hypothetical protein [Solirubrobacteraceae bacterium]